jgi:hypothetical protein
MRYYLGMQNDDEADEIPAVEQRSDVAEDLADLHSTVVKLAKAREQLPQPLFWSLFHSRLRGIKKHKQLSRTLNTALCGDAE